MTDAERWNKIAATFEEDVLNVFKADKNDIIKKWVRKYAGKNKVAIDFGCGIGRGLPLLSPLFKKVIAVDVSAKCVKTAELLGYKNVEFGIADLAGKKINLPKADFVLCTNVAISGSKRRNYQIIKNTLAAVKKGGTALFVLPSQESSSISSWRLLDWWLKEGAEVKDIPSSDLKHLIPRKPSDIRDGIIDTANAPTEHYLLRELYTIFNKPQLAINCIGQVQYNWNTEFNSAPKWMREPYPWDWLVVVKKVK